MGTGPGTEIPREVGTLLFDYRELGGGWLGDSVARDPASSDVFAVDSWRKIS